MIAEIIPRIKLPRRFIYFDYLVPKELEEKIKIGQLVEIPFRQKNIEGLVHNIKKRGETKKSQLKSINKIFNTVPPFQDYQLKLLRWASRYYFVSPGLILKGLAPAIPKRERKSMVPVSVGQKYLKNFQYQVDFKQQSLNFDIEQNTLFCYQKTNDKLNLYLRLAKKTIAKNKQTAFIVPDLVELSKLYHFFIKHFPRETISLFLADLPKGHFFDEWLSIAQNKKKIIIGTRSAIFAPLMKPFFIIIDEEERKEHKQSEPNPRYDTRSMALKISEFEKVRVLFTSRTPRIQLNYQVKKKKVAMVQKQGLKIVQPKLIDLNNEMRGGNYSLISDPLEKGIQRSLLDNKQTALFLNRRGVARIVACKDCKFIFKCGHCRLPMIHHLFNAGRELYCHHCNKRMPIPLTCPECSGTNLKSLGRGTQSVELDLKKRYPKLNITRIDSDADIENLTEKYIDRADIIIGTIFMWRYLKWLKVGCLGILSADTFLNIPDFRSSEKTFEFICGAILTSSEQKNPPAIFIQTYSPKNIILKTASSCDYETFYINEIKERKIFHYPPFYRLIKLIYQDTDNKKCLGETKNIFYYLKTKTKNIIGIEINEPLPSYRTKIRNKYRWNIIIRATNESLGELSRILQEIPESWIIDIDPENLI